MLIIAAILTVTIGIVHSYLGERYLLSRLFRQSLPELFGNDSFARKTLRFAWHITTIAWFGFAAVFALLHFGAMSRTNVLYSLSITFLITGLVALIASKGKHLSWIIFLAIATLAFASVDVV